MIKVNFVCHGNICRSPMAEFILKKMAKDRGIDISVSSSATSYEEIGNDIHPGTKRVLTAHSIPLKEVLHILKKKIIKTMILYFVWTATTLKI